MKKVFLFFIISLSLALTLVSAQDVALDIKINGNKQTYSAGENLSYQIILKDSSNLNINDKVDIAISDISENKILNFIVDSNKDQIIFINRDFVSGYWKIQATYEGKTVTRLFSVGERQEADMRIDGDKLLITNTGNVPYERTLQIAIGDKVFPQKISIGINGFKEIRLVAPEGNYDVQVTDGINTISKQNVYLTGTGRVVGALDEQLVENPPVIGGARDVNSDSFFSSKNFPIAFIFIAAIFGLFVLITIEKGIRKHRASSAKEIIGIHQDSA